MPTAKEIDDISAELKDWRLWAGQWMLAQLDVPELASDSRVRDRGLAFRNRLAMADRKATNKLLEFFELSDYSLNEEIWSGPGVRLFVSHASQDKAAVQPLLKNLAQYGIIAFMAHEDIRPAQSWRNVLLSALGAMDVLLAFHTEAFAASEWCGQEAGFAIARDVPIISVMAGSVPSGFLSAYQGVKLNASSPGTTAESIVNIVVSHPKAMITLGDSMSRKLKFTGSFDGSDFLVGQIEKCSRLSDKAKRNLRLALLLNDQVSGRSNAEALLGVAGKR